MLYLNEVDEGDDLISLSHLYNLFEICEDIIPQHTYLTVLYINSSNKFMN